MTPLEKRMQSLLLNGRSLVPAEIKEILTRIAPDCETTEGLDEQEKLLWLAMNWESDDIQALMAVDNAQEWIDGCYFDITAHRRKPKPVKPRIGYLSQHGNAALPPVEQIRGYTPAIELTPEVRAALVAAGIEVGEQ